jgi:hypothetical protein
MKRSMGIRWVLALVGAGVAFGLGWLAGQRTPPPEPTTAAPSASLRPEDVELRLDAGSLTLLPEGGLTLEPIEPLGGAPPEDRPRKVESP